MSTETSGVLSWKPRDVEQMPTKPLKFMASTYMQDSQKFQQWASSGLSEITGYPGMH